MLFNTKFLTVVDCGPPPVFFNGTVSYQNTTEGSEADYHCEDGFTLEGEMTAVCRADGRWSFPPVCGPLTGSMINYLRYVGIINKINSTVRYSFCDITIFKVVPHNINIVRKYLCIYTGQDCISYSRFQVRWNIALFMTCFCKIKTERPEFHYEMVHTNVTFKHNGNRL